MSRAAPRFNPFPGLRPFTTAERHLFFGREAQCAELLTRLRRFRFLAAVGPSGSGKSSLVRAGLLPELYGGTMRGAGSHWEIAIMRPGGDPIRHLAEALAESQVFDPGDPDTRSIIQAALNRSGLGLVDAVAKSALPTGGKLLVVVDQFEELFRFHRQTAAAADSAGAFVNLLLEATRQTAVPLYVVITMRSDFLGECALYRGLAEAVNESEYLIPRLTREQWKLAIEGPVRVGGGHLSPRLTQRLLNDVADDPDQLPTLQHALMRTWEHWVAHGQTERPMDLEDYEAVGGMAEALSRHADEVYARLPDDAHRKIAERLFRALTDMAGDNRGLRRPTRLGDLVAMVQAPETQVRTVVDAFRAEGCGFLTPPAELDAESVIDISHESLMRVWRRLREWADAEAQSARMFRRLADAAEQWRRGRGDLYRDPGLEYALLWRQENQPGIAWAQRLGGGFELVEEFLAASRAARDAERAAREAARRRELEQARQLAEAQRLRAESEARAAVRMRRLALGMAVLAFVALAAGAVAWHLRRIAEARALVANARDAAHTDPQAALAFSVKAYEGYRSGFTEASLRRDLLASPLRHILRPVAAPAPPLEFRRVAFSPDGTVIAAHHVETETSSAGWLWLWRFRTGETNCLPCGEGELKVMEFTPDSRFLLTAGGDQTARIWDVANHRLAANLPALPGTIRAAELSPGGTNLVIADETGRVQLWDWDGSNATRLMEWDHPGGVADACFGPRGEFVASAGADGRVLFWRAGSPDPYYRNEVWPPGLAAIAFSPDGAWMAVATSDAGESVQGGEGTLVPRVRQVMVYEIRGGLRGFSRERGPVTALRFNPAGDHLVLVGSRGAETWSLSGLLDPGDPTPRAISGRELASESQVFEAGYSPDGRWFFAALDNHELRLWSASGLEGPRFRGHQRQVNSAAFSPDGTLIASAAFDGTVRVWDARAVLGELLRPAGEDEEVKAVTFDGSRFVVRDRGGEWRMGQSSQSGQAVRVVAQMVTNFTATVFSPDGRWLVTAEDVDLFLREGTIGSIVAPFSAYIERGDRDQSLRASQTVFRPLALAFAGDGKRLAAVDGEGRLVEWDVANRTPRRALAGQKSTFPRLALDHDGSVVALAGDAETIQVWHGSNLAAVELSAAALQDGPRCLALDPGGQWLAAGSIKGSVWFSRTDGSDRAGEFPAHNRAVNVLAWSADGRFLASGGADGTICLWARGGTGRASAAEAWELVGQRSGFATDVISGRDWTLAGLAFGETSDSSFPARSVPVLVAASAFGEIRRYELPELADRSQLNAIARQRLLHRDQPRQGLELWGQGGWP